MAADAVCVPTGIYVDSGTRLEFIPSGRIRACRGIGGAGPEGYRKTPRGKKRPSRNAPYGCLLGRVGPDGRLFPLKKKRSVNLRGYGQLMLMVNCTDRSEAGGEFAVEIRLRYACTDVAERRTPDGARVVREDGRTVLFRGQDVMEALRRALG